MTEQETNRDVKQKNTSPRSSGKMTVEEAGRKGGEKTAETRGPEFYQAIGKKGGEAVSRDRQHMSEIGRKGGEAVSRNRAHMAHIGQKGGEARSRAFKRQQLEMKRTVELTRNEGASTDASQANASKQSKKEGGEQEKAG